MCTNIINSKSVLDGIISNILSDRYIVIKLFLYKKLISKELLEIVCHAANSKLKTYELSTKDLTYGEFLRWIRLWLLISANKLG